MPTYPIELRLADRRVVVIGAGPVGQRKIGGLVAAGARVLWVDPELDPAERDGSHVTCARAVYAPRLIEGAVLVFACTNDKDLNARIAADAHERGIWCNVADDPSASDYLVPAVLRRGRMTIAVGTEGASPATAGAIRDSLASQFGEEYAVFMDELARARDLVREGVSNEEVRRQIFTTLCATCSLECLRQRGRSGWREWLERVIAHRARAQGSDDGPLDPESPEV